MQPTADTAALKPARFRWLWAVAIGGVLLLWFGLSRGRGDVEPQLREARRLLRRSEFQQAEVVARQALQTDPASAEAQLLAAEAAAGNDAPQRALAYLQDLTAGQTSKFTLDAWLLAAELQHFHTFQFAAAEAAYHKALQLDPGNLMASQGLAKLLSVCGRRQEAIPHILQLLDAGIASDLLYVLARESGAIDDLQLLQNAHRAAPEDAGPLLGLARQAERHGDLAEAVRLARLATQVPQTLPVAEAELGRYLLMLQQFDELDEWNQNLSKAALQFAQTWRVRGFLLEHQQAGHDALKSWLQALRIAPELKDVSFRVSRLLYQAGQPQWGDRFAAHLDSLHRLEAMQDRVIFAGGPPDPQAYIDLVQACLALGRIWEAWGWTHQGLQVFPDQRQLLSLRAELAKRRQTLAAELVPDDLNPASQVDAAAVELPDAVPVVPDSLMTDSSAAAFSFREEATARGLQFSYFNGVHGPTQRRMFEFTGGGVGVVDVDGDSWPDVALSQGRPWDAAKPDPAFTDRLFRNQSGESFTDISAVSGFQGTGFGQGIAVGDCNGDGFADLFVANIGANQLWLNNGDGTFSDGSAALPASDNWTTSAAVADLNNDGWPDIYAVNYLQADDVFDRVCRDAKGNAVLCPPTSFDGVPDQLLISDGQGQYSDGAQELVVPPPAGKGLGVVVWDSTGTGRLSVFVANDTTYNHFLRPSADNAQVLTDDAFIAGVAVNSEGRHEGCMGIAVGDIGADGLQDLFVTNFLAESNTFYRALNHTVFEDQTRRLGLYDSSLDLLGFGTQFLDVDLDGVLELFVANGHVDDLRHQGKPWKMLPRLLRQSDSGFQIVEPESVGPWFETEQLGRAVARLDWNRDGRQDLLVGQLHAETALLTNTTDSAGHNLSVTLHGTVSTSDAVGTEVTVRIGDRRIVAQIVAGDGYQASNQRQLIFGCGPADRVDELQIRWPSGQQQTFHDLQVPADLSLCESRSQVYPIP